MSGATNPWVALRPGMDASRVARDVESAHDAFLLQGESAADVRPVVLDSWQRSLRSGVDPDSEATESWADADLRSYRNSHPMSIVRPIVRRLLLDDIAETGLLVAISDADGRLLWVEGDHAAKDRAALMNFAEGADWSERRVGTNAPGTALVVDDCVQIFASEHFSRVVQDWSCSAAPVHDPLSGAMLGAIDITGGPRVAAPEVLSLVRATVAAAEAHLSLKAAGAALGSQVRTGSTLSVLGGPAELIHEGRRVQLSRRHAEVLLLLAENPEGMSADRLAVLLDEADLDAVTVRAEVSRLRRVLGADAVTSRPYRLAIPLRTDVGAVRSALDRGDTAGALGRYRGPLLPESNAPGIVELREELRTAMRAALLRSAEPDLMREWTLAADGRDDRDCWAAYRSLLDPASPRYAQASARIELLDRRFGQG